MCLQGRTRLFQDDDGSYIACKVQKRLVFTLVCGGRGVETIKNQHRINKDKLWKGLADQIIHNAAQLVSELTGTPLPNMKIIINQTVSRDALASQMSVWM